MNFNDIFGQMAAMAVHCNKWGGSLTLTPELLNVPPTPEVRAALRFGTIRLAPKEAYEKLEALEREARAALERVSVKFAKIPGARLVRLDTLDALQGKLREIRASFDKEVDVFAADLPRLRDFQMPVIEEALTRAMHIDTAQPNHPDTVRQLEILNRAMVVIRAAYPDASEVTKRFRLRWSSPFSIDRSKGAVSKDDVAAEIDDVKEVVRGIVEELRSDFTERVKAIKELVAKGGKLTKKTTNSAREALTRLKNLNIVGDKVLDDQITAVELWLNRIDTDADGAVQGGLILGLDTVAAAVQGDVESAVANAEQALTSVGRRRLQVVMPVDTAGYDVEAVAS
jgi:hypothetical protein